MRRIILYTLCILLGISTLVIVLPINAQDGTITVDCGTSLVDQEISNTNTDDTFTIALNAGDTITIGLDVLGQGVEINVQLFDPSQTPLNIPVSQPGTPPLVRKVGAAGEYTFVISKYIGVSLYTLNIGCVLRNGTEIKPGDSRLVITPPVTPSPVVQEAILHVFISRESLTLYVTQTVSLSGLQFGAIVNGQLKLNTLTDLFDSLLLTGGLANINDCYIYVIDGASPPLSQSCKGQVFRTSIASADVFWYDSVSNLARNLAIFRDGQSTGIVCSAVIPDCTVKWIVVIPPTPILPTATITPIPTELPPVVATMTNSSPTFEATAAQIPITGPYIMTKQTYVNVRSGPGTAFTIIGTVDGNVAIPVVARTPDRSWFRVQVGSLTGWVVGYLFDFSGDPLSVPVEQYMGTITPSIGSPILPTATLSLTQPSNSGAYVVAKINSNVRSGPGTTFSSIATLNAGNSAPVISRTVDGTWFKVQTSNGIGWIAASVVDLSVDITSIPIEEYAFTATPPSSQSYITVDTYQLNIRSGPGSQYEILAILKRGDTALVIARNAEGTWYKIQLPNLMIGWVAANSNFIGTYGDTSQIPVSNN